MRAYKIDEQRVSHMRLGRHVHHDTRSLRYPFKAASLPLGSARWSHDDDPILDQGDLGSCTGNATVAAFICSSNNLLRQALPQTLAEALDEDLAIRVYSRGTELDTFPGTYAPTDTGCDGLSVAKAAQEFGYISSYSHAFSADDALAALTVGPIIIGIAWYAGYDTPDNLGRVSRTGSLRGGHEICVDEINVDEQTIWFRNSWSDQWGYLGRACMTWETFRAALAEDGDATVFAPLTAPTPTPVPSPTPDPDEVDQELLDISGSWVAHRKTYSPNESLRQVLMRWRSSRGQ